MIVTEQDVPSPKSASADVTVTITDANDNDPEFPPAGYDVKVAEGGGRREIVKVCCLLFTSSTNRGHVCVIV